MKSHKRYSFLFLALFFLFTNTIEAQLSSEMTGNTKLATSGDKASNALSDTIDILNYNIDLDMTDFVNRKIAGSCEITLVAKQGSTTMLYFDLLKLNVGQVLMGGNSLPFNYNDTLLKVRLPAPIVQNDTVKLKVFYSGSPVQDASWGGFYYQGNYAYNLGVGFDANPHNYGRVWFPCFDNFVERSTFDFSIKTANGRKAHCNGALVAENQLGGDTVVRLWRMNEEIPSYLACVAVGLYETVHLSYPGVQNVIPIELAAEAVDTTDVKSSFLHLADAMAAYEKSFGPYQFNKVGYAIVPFNAGAMEHATNIAYPRYAVDGSLANETLMAHELSHHWWGDLVTCETAEDMWINEGMASFSEQLFLEEVYGKTAYLDAVQRNHLNVLQYAHVREKTYRAVHGVPHEYTYGMHVYDKGAAVAHNLRGYLGDSLFFDGLQNYLGAHAFTAVNSMHLRDKLSLRTGVDLSNFFNDWVFSAGFSHFSIDSMQITPQGQEFDVRLFLKQKRRGAPAFHQTVPIWVRFWDKKFNSIKVLLTVSGAQEDFQLTLPFEPAFAALNTDQTLNLATTSDQLVVSKAGTYTLPFGKMDLEVIAVTDSTLVRVEHHWASPDMAGLDPSKIRLSDYRYWSVDGLFEDDFVCNATVYYDGRNFSSGGEGQLDVDLLKTGEDSILLMYRPSAASGWREFRSYQLDKLASSSDRYGKITIDTLRKGQYALAKGQSVLGITKEHAERNALLRVYPNPAQQQITLQLDATLADQKVTLSVYDASGKHMMEKEFVRHLTLDLSEFAKGSYLFVVRWGAQQLASEKVLVE
jgi:hypothetical protein